MSTMDPPARLSTPLRPFVWLAAIAFLTGFWAVLLAGIAGLAQDHDALSRAGTVSPADRG